jgi:hypothetical protein
MNPPHRGGDLFLLLISSTVIELSYQFCNRKEREPAGQSNPAPLKRGFGAKESFGGVDPTRQPGWVNNLVQSFQGTLRHFAPKNESGWLRAAG